MVSSITLWSVTFFISSQDTAAHASCSPDAIWRWQQQRMLYFLSQLLQYTKETVSLQSGSESEKYFIANFIKPWPKSALSKLDTRWQRFLPCILQHIENKVSKSRLYNRDRTGKWGLNKRKKKVPFESEQSIAEGRDQYMLLLPYWIVSSSFS